MTPTSPTPRARTTRRLLLATATALLWASDASGQLAHYWGDHFGNESVLLNGAVIGSVTDPGAVFYNPARLPHQEAPAFVASAKLYEWSSARVENGVENGDRLEQSRFGGAPGFLVGSFNVPFLAGHEFAYGILTRYRGSVNFSVRDERAADLLDFLPGTDSYLGYIDVGTDMKDDWVGVSWAHDVSEKWSLGASIFWYERSFSRRAGIDLRAISETLDAAALDIQRSYELRDKGLVGKLGVAWRHDKVSAGASVTLPYWSWSSKGSVRYENFAVGLPDSVGLPADNVLESSVQGGLPVDWRAPWSVGAGAGWTVDAFQFHFAAEYFARVPAHVLLQARPEPGQSTGDPIDYTVVDERAAVFNAGAGVRWIVSGDFSTFGSVVTNFSAAPDDVVDFGELRPVVSHTSQKMDFILVGGGFSVHTRWADLTLGATRQASSQETPRFLSFPTTDPAAPPDEATLKYDQWRFLFGFSLPLVNERLGAVTG